MGTLAFAMTIGPNVQFFLPRLAVPAHPDDTGVTGGPGSDGSRVNDAGPVGGGGPGPGPGLSGGAGARAALDG